MYSQNSSVTKLLNCISSPPAFYPYKPMVCHQDITRWTPPLTNSTTTLDTKFFSRWLKKNVEKKSYCRGIVRVIRTRKSHHDVISLRDKWYADSCFQIKIDKDVLEGMVTVPETVYFKEETRSTSHIDGYDINMTI